MKFKEWLLSEDDMRTGAKLGLYPSLYDSLGQYPPLYMTPIASDFVTYYDIQYGKKGIKTRSPGIIDAGGSDHLKINKQTWKNFKQT